ncbi:hypothetical protein U1Q18_036338 [Sarracenia purpurea var. burkii]
MESTPLRSKTQAKGTTSGWGPSIPPGTRRWSTTQSDPRSTQQIGEPYVHRSGNEGINCSGSSLPPIREYKSQLLEDLNQLLDDQASPAQLPLPSIDRSTSSKFDMAWATILVLFCWLAALFMQCTISKVLVVGVEGNHETGELRVLRNLGSISLNLRLNLALSEQDMEANSWSSASQDLAAVKVGRNELIPTNSNS